MFMEALAELRARPSTEQRQQSVVLRQKLRKDLEEQVPRTQIRSICGGRLASVIGCLCLACR